MKKTILSFILTLTIHFVFAQNPITISSTCETLDYHDTYSLDPNPDYSTINGKPYYSNSNGCSQHLTEVECSSEYVTEYHIFWNGTSWVLEYGGSGNAVCYWLFDYCIPAGALGEGDIIATNSADTPYPPTTDWTFTTTPACTPTFDNTLSTNDLFFKNSIEIFPNPIENDFVIKTKGYNDLLHVTILNSLGQVIVSKAFTNSQEIKLGLNQPSGIYFAKITNKENDITYFKLIKK